LAEYAQRRASLVQSVAAVDDYKIELPKNARAKARQVHAAGKATSRSPTKTLEAKPSMPEVATDQMNEHPKPQERQPVRPTARPSFLACMEALNQQRNGHRGIQFEQKLLQK